MAGRMKLVITSTRLSATTQARLRTIYSMALAMASSGLAPEMLLSSYSTCASVFFMPELANTARKMTVPRSAM
jgi:hypothetical protein